MKYQDKERILMALLTQVYAKAMYAPMSTDKWKRMPPLYLNHFRSIFSRAIW